MKIPYQWSGKEDTPAGTAVYTLGPVYNYYLDLPSLQLARQIHQMLEETLNYGIYLGKCHYLQQLTELMENIRKEIK